MWLIAIYSQRRARFVNNRLTEKLCTCASAYMSYYLACAHYYLDQRSEVKGRCSNFAGGGVSELLSVSLYEVQGGQGFESRWIY